MDSLRPCRDTSLNNLLQDQNRDPYQFSRRDIRHINKTLKLYQRTRAAATKFITPRRPVAHMASSGTTQQAAADITERGPRGGL